MQVKDTRSSIKRSLLNFSFSLSLLLYGAAKAALLVFVSRVAIFWYCYIFIIGLTLSGSLSDAKRFILARKELSN